MDDWTAIRSTSYIFPNTNLTDAQAAAYNAAGFEIGLHLNTGCADITRASPSIRFSVNSLDQLTCHVPESSFSDDASSALHTLERLHHDAGSGVLARDPVGCELLLLSSKLG